MRSPVDRHCKKEKDKNTDMENRWRDVEDVERKEKERDVSVLWEDLQLLDGMGGWDGMGEAGCWVVFLFFSFLFLFLFFLFFFSSLSF